MNLTPNPGAPCTKGDDGIYHLPSNAWSGVGLYDYYALRLSQIFDIWDAEYGADKSKIVHIVSEWTSFPSEIETILSYGQTANHLAEKADVIATAGYVSPFSIYSPAIRNKQVTWKQVARMSPGDLTKAMIDSIDRELAPQFRAAREHARKWGLGFVVYEGGEGNAASGAPHEYVDALARLYAATARDPAMAEVYAHLLDTWKAAGGTLFNQFYDVSRYGGVFGDWGAIEYQDQDLESSPKYKGLVDWIAKNSVTAR